VSSLADWSPPPGRHCITTLETHAAGEPLRIITSGLPEIPGATMLERRRWVREHLDDVRRALMWEPRGHNDMYGAIVTPPVTEGAVCGVLFMHNEGYSTMCGHGIIALATALVETGVVSAVGAASVEMKIDAPAGLVTATAHFDGSGRVSRVSFRNVPSFLFARDLEISVEPWGTFKVDVAFGGAFYALVPAERVGLEVLPGATGALVEAGESIKRAVNSVLDIRHPVDADLGYLYGAILTGSPADAAHHSRNICVFASGEVDRSPTGTGVSARIAQLVARSEVSLGTEITIESILGAASTFSVRAVTGAAVGDFAGVIPEVSGKAALLGRAEWSVDPADALGGGFLL
jgi:proline racemase